jgi:hypothetical protein
MQGWLARVQPLQQHQDTLWVPTQVFNEGVSQPDLLKAQLLLLPGAVRV